MADFRENYLAEHFNEWLDRFSPPRRIANDADAMQRDVDEMLGIVGRYAPRSGYDAWLTEVLRRLQEGMTTRSWPAPGELARACRGSSGEHRGGNDAETEARAVDRMAEWQAKFGGQMPGHGRPSRTAALIRRGVLASEREARFLGYDLGDGQRARAAEQPMGRAEWQHHVAVMARLRGQDIDTTETQLLAEERRPPQKAAPIPDKRMPKPQEDAL